MCRVGCRENLSRTVTAVSSASVITRIRAAAEASNALVRPNEATRAPLAHLCRGAAERHRRCGVTYAECRARSRRGRRQGRSASWRSPVTRGGLPQPGEGLPGRSRRPRRGRGTARSRSRCFPCPVGVLCGGSRPYGVRIPPGDLTRTELPIRPESGSWRGAGDRVDFSSTETIPPRAPPREPPTRLDSPRRPSVLRVDVCFPHRGATGERGRRGPGAPRTPMRHRQEPPRRRRRPAGPRRRRR